MTDCNQVVTVLNTFSTLTIQQSWPKKDTLMAKCTWKMSLRLDSKVFSALLLMLPKAEM